MKRKHLLYASIIIMIVTLGIWYSSNQKDSADNTSPGSAGNVVSQTGGWTEVDGKFCYFLADGTPASGWTEIDGQLYYLNTDGSAVSGWLNVDSNTYYFFNGNPATGWLHIDGYRYYLKDDGTPASGWTEIDGQRCYFTENGTPVTGWTEIDGSRYYLNINGAPLTGTQEIEGEIYHFNYDGTFYTGWITMGGQRYYCLDNGGFATGKTVIDGKTYYFTPEGIHVVLVNPWCELPEDHATNLLPLDNGMFVEAECYQDLMEMLTDCKAAGYTPYVCSAYRTQADQTYLFQRKVKYYLDLDFEQEEAEELAATVVARPGTSEHQLGLAMDIIEEDFPYLTDEQADTPTQQWLMAHCWEYGFILRYPKDTTDITGIIWEPWHYRYVGKEIAAEIYELGITLEEYLGFTQE